MPFRQVYFNRTPGKKQIDRERLIITGGCWCHTDFRNDPYRLPNPDRHISSTKQGALKAGTTGRWDISSNGTYLNPGCVQLLCKQRMYHDPGTHNDRKENKSDRFHHLGRRLTNYKTQIGIPFYREGTVSANTREEAFDSLARYSKRSCVMHSESLKVASSPQK